MENKHGAIQVKRGGDLLFSARSDARMIITHPIYTGKGKKKERFFKHQGSMWDNLTQLPFKEVTLEMLQKRIDDKKTRADYHKEFYGGKNAVKSGLYIKSEATKVRLADDGKKKKNVKADAKAAKKAKNIVQRQAAKKTSKKGKSAIARVRKPVSSKPAAAKA